MHCPKCGYKLSAGETAEEFAGAFLPIIGDIFKMRHRNCPKCGTKLEPGR